MASKYMELMAEVSLDFIMIEAGEAIKSEALRLPEGACVIVELPGLDGFGWYFVTLRNPDEVLCFITDKKPSEGKTFQFGRTCDVDSVLAARKYAIDKAA